MQRRCVYLHMSAKILERELHVHITNKKDCSLLICIYYNIFSLFLQICAHRWKDNYLNLNYNGISHMNGICYQLNASLSRTARKIPALTIRERLVHRDRYTEFSMGGLGTSAIFTGVTLTFTYLCLLALVCLL